MAAPDRASPTGPADRDVGVLWTTHLLDEIEPSDNLVILHQGRVLANGVVADTVAASGHDS